MTKTEKQLSSNSSKEYGIDRETFRKLCPRGHLTTPYRIIQERSYDRDQAKAGFPYISFKHFEALKVIYAAKLVNREVIDYTVFTNMEAKKITTAASTNRRLRTLVDKDYLNVIKLWKPPTHYYALTDLAFNFLGRPSYDTDFSEQEINSLIAVNSKLAELAESYLRDRKEEEGVDYTVGWEAQPRIELVNGKIWEQDALACVWKGQECIEAKAYIVTDTLFFNDLIEKVDKLKHDYSELIASPLVKRFDVDVVEQASGTARSFIRGGEFSFDPNGE